MTRDNTIMILGILKTSYPNFYKDMSNSEMYNVLDLWSEMFEKDDLNLVKLAVKELIQTLKFPPTIADVKQKMDELTCKETLPVDLWASLKKAVRNSIYNAEEEFAKLPEECKMFIKSPAQLREIAVMDSDVVDSVTKGQFLKQIETIQKRLKEDRLMLPETKKYREMALSIGQDVSGLLN